MEPFDSEANGRDGLSYRHNKRPRPAEQDGGKPRLPESETRAEKLLC